MRVLLTRLVRMRFADPALPRTCWALHDARAFLDADLECDCSVFCKVPPPGNAPGIVPCVAVDTGRPAWRTVERTLLRGAPSSHRPLRSSAADLGRS